MGEGSGVYARIGISDGQFPSLTESQMFSFFLLQFSRILLPFDITSLVRLLVSIEAVPVSGFLPLGVS